MPAKPGRESDRRIREAQLRSSLTPSWAQASSSDGERLGGRQEDLLVIAFQGQSGRGSRRNLHLAGPGTSRKLEVDTKSTVWNARKAT